MNGGPLKLRLVVAAFTIAVIALGSVTSPKQASQAATERIIPATTSDPVATGSVLVHGPASEVTALDTRTDRVVYRVPSGLVGPDQERVYSSSATSVVVRDADTGTRLARVARPAGMELAVASTSGELLAFATPRPDGTTEWRPGRRARTKITIVSTDNKRTARTYDLQGNFVPEAFATNDRELFLVEFMPARAPWHYGLRRLILASGAIREIQREKQGAPDDMDGTGRLAIFSPAGHELYTLYTQQGFNYTHVDPAEAEDTDEVYAFVHLLNLNGGWTHCIDLPAPFGTGTATTHAMATSADGTSLYVADPSSGGLALIDPLASLVTRSVTADLGAMKRGVAAAVGPDGVLYLAGRTKVLVFDGTTLSLVRELRIPRGRPGVAVSSDGTHLILIRKGRVVMLDATTGEVANRAMRRSS